MTNKVKEHTGFHYSLSKIRLAVYFDSFRTEYILQDVLNKIKDKSTSHKKFRMQSDDSIKCGFYCIIFIKYMIAGKTWEYNI